jgi:hypothetical protein
MQTYSLIKYKECYHLVPDNLITSKIRQIFELADRAKNDDSALFNTPEGALTYEEYQSMRKKGLLLKRSYCIIQREDKSLLAPDEKTRIERLKDFYQACSYFDYIRDDIDDSCIPDNDGNGIFDKFEIEKEDFNRRPIGTIISHIYEWTIV